MDKIKEIWAGLPTWAKWVAPIVGGGLLLWGGYKLVFKKKYRS